MRGLFQRARLLEQVGGDASVRIDRHAQDDKAPPRIRFDGAQENVIEAAVGELVPDRFPARVAVMRCFAVAARRAARGRQVCAIFIVP